MLVFIILLAALIAAGIYWWKGRRGVLYMRQLGQDVRHHWVAATLLLLYSVICGVMFVVGFNPLLVSVPLALPFIAGICVGWWEARRETERSRDDRLIGYGILGGFLAMLLPALILIVGNAALTWTGAYELEPGKASGFLAETVGWAGGLLGLGVIFGVVGAYSGTWMAQNLGRIQH
jgi:uncharacterized membrane protein YphA (DoxX/SURF4 family)